jgi:hypothetical protein
LKAFKMMRKFVIFPMVFAQLNLEPNTKRGVSFQVYAGGARYTTVFCQNNFDYCIGYFIGSISPIQTFVNIPALRLKTLPNQGRDIHKNVNRRYHLNQGSLDSDELGVVAMTPYQALLAILKFLAAWGEIKIFV